MAATFGGSSGILQELVSSGLAAKEYKSLSNGISLEYTGGGVLLVEGASFNIIKLDSAVNVRSNLFKDFSRGYAYGYGYGYGYAKAASNQIDHTSNAGYRTSNSGGIGYGVTDAGEMPYYDIGLAARTYYHYKSDTTGSDKESTKNQEVVKYDFYTIPFAEYIKITATGVCYAIVYGG